MVAMHCGVVAMWEAVVAMHSAVVMHCILGFLQWLLWVRFFWFDSFKSFELKRFLHSVDMWLMVARCIRMSACPHTYWKFGGKRAKVLFTFHCICPLGCNPLMYMSWIFMYIYIYRHARIQYPTFNTKWDPPRPLKENSALRLIDWQVWN